MDDLDLLERFFVRDENTLHRPVGCHRHAVESIVQIIEQHLGDADQAGGQPTGAQALGQAARRQKLGLALAAAGERRGIEIRHGADSVGH